MNDDREREPEAQGGGLPGPIPEPGDAETRPPHASLAAFGEAREPDVWAALGQWRADGRRMVLLTVVESRGFTPRKPGTHMLLGADGRTVGTIGGGAIEQEALNEARALLAGGGGSKTVKKHLTQDLGMCCGGEMVIYLETLEAPPRLFVFGAGYVARPIAALASACGFAVTVIDGREAWATAARFPGMTVRCADPEAVARTLETHADDYAIVVTHDHELDQHVVQELLRRPLRFTGMIGSLAKARKFALRLKARGFTDEQIARLRTPLGLAIGAQTPEEIAISVMGELVAVRRGGAPERGWVPRGTHRAEGQGPAVAAASSPEGSRG